MAQSLYEELGVAPSADRASIKRAYKQKAQRAHPDRPGGSAEAFQRLRHAYALLTDESRRAAYDRHGEDGPVQDEHAMLLNALAGMVLAAIDHAEPDRDNLLLLVRDQLREIRAQHTSAKANITKAIGKRERALKRLRKKDPVGADLITAMIEGDIGAKRRALEIGEREIGRLDTLTAMLLEYEYRVTGGGSMEGGGVGPFVGLSLHRWPP